MDVPVFCDTEGLFHVHPTSSPPSKIASCPFSQSFTEVVIIFPVFSGISSVLSDDEQPDNTIMRAIQRENGFFIN